MSLQIAWVANGHDIEQFWRLTFAQIELVFAGDRQHFENRQALAYYQAYMAGLFSQSYKKNKFPKYEEHAPWKKRAKPIEERPADYDKRLEQMMKVFTQSVGGKVQ